MNYRNQLAANSNPKKEGKQRYIKKDRAAMAAWAFVGITLAVLVLDSTYLALYFGCLAKGEEESVPNAVVPPALDFWLPG